MPVSLEIVLIIILIATLIAILYRVLTKNKKIIFRGHDDYIYSALALIVVLAINPVNETMSYYGILRSMLLLVVVFAQFAIKRGISIEGFEKIYFTVSWDKVQNVYIQSVTTSVSKIAITFELNNKLRLKLYFKINLLPQLVDFLETKLPEVKVETELVKKYNQLSKKYKE